MATGIALVKQVHQAGDFRADFTADDLYQALVAKRAGAAAPAKAQAQGLRPARPLPPGQPPPAPKRIGSSARWLEPGVELLTPVPLRARPAGQIGAGTATEAPAGLSGGLLTP